MPSSKPARKTSRSTLQATSSAVAKPRQNRALAQDADRAAGPGRPKDLEKRAAILDAAKRLFPERGYEGVSMEAIAAEAGVSKLTVYNHFQDKETLFSEAVKCRCEEQLPHRLFEVDLQASPLREVLLEIGRAFHALITSEEAVQLHRTLAARALTDTRLATLFYEAGPRRTVLEFETFLRRAVKLGLLKIDDPHRAAGHFFCLLKGEDFSRLVVGCCDSLPRAACAAHVDSVVDLFLRAYARKS
ncbi:TetR/AcrR family transcriptional regulator [Pseudomarimonas arenosa]|uniref:TetR/AcrR family transcriptional regulator n=1 Tax=Pseudomarimonas arenosa TaxID=2774145 RepID=A0AAW3ZFM8_9GAMM|nr:TetR/AcrR family transcriptional regulator [Pseudomarimonas arenosa]MBD8524908.1 TetR/AcrR family transcriptional regulator [Pseudomarimonas arenosa]